MAQSPAHKFGQIIGNVIETAVEPLLEQFARKHSLFLDKKGPRPARKGNKVTWTDHYGNNHDLDFVLERNGTPHEKGSPVAFIESAWRRYTKHSRNKAQEIQGALLPLADSYRSNKPFVGAILAGVFTEGALNQLRSLGFSIVYFPYKTVIQAFAKVEIEARFTEDTSRKEFSTRVRLWERLSPRKKRLVSESLVPLNKAAVQEFMVALERVVTRVIQLVRILPLHGHPTELPSVDEAIRFINGYDEVSSGIPVSKYEIQIRYTNGDRIEAYFEDKKAAVDFLRMFA